LTSKTTDMFITTTEDLLLHIPDHIFFTLTDRTMSGDYSHDIEPYLLW